MTTLWKDLLSQASQKDHLVQLYTDQDFLGEAVAHFATAGLEKGESIIIVATPLHWEDLSRRLEANGVAVQTYAHRGQLTVIDAEEFLPRFMVDGMPDQATFLDLAAGVIERARAGDRYPKVRWWGEMVNLLWMDNNLPASLRLEELFDHVALTHSLSIFCSFLMDNFSRDVHERALPGLYKTHSHIIPARDIRFETAVDRALKEIIGDMQADALRAISESRGFLSESFPHDESDPRRLSVMPFQQNALRWLRVRAPAMADAVLERAREHFDGVPKKGHTEENKHRRRASDRMASSAPPEQAPNPVLSDQLREVNAQLMRSSVQAQERADTSELRFHYLIEELDAIIWEAEAETRRVTFVNQRAEMILGYPVQRWLEEPDFWATVIHPENRDQIVRYCKSAMMVGKDYQIEYRALASDGRVLWLAERVRIRLTANRPSHLFGMIIDMTERKLIEERLVRTVSELQRAKEDLQEKNDELEKFHDLTVDRELKMIRVEREGEGLRVQCQELEKQCEILSKELAALSEGKTTRSLNRSKYLSASAERGESS